MIAFSIRIFISLFSLDEEYVTQTHRPLHRAISPDSTILKLPQRPFSISYCSRFLASLNTSIKPPDRLEYSNRYSMIVHNTNVFKFWNVLCIILFGSPSSFVSTKRGIRIYRDLTCMRFFASFVYGRLRHCIISPAKRRFLICPRPRGYIKFIDE